MRFFLLFAAVAVLASCAPSASPTSSTWDYYDNEPGGIQVNGPATYDDMLGAQTPAEACASLGAEAFPSGFCAQQQRSSPNSNGATGRCESGSAFEIAPPGWATPGNPWIVRCP